MFPEMGMEEHGPHFPARARAMQTTGDLHLAWYVPYQPGTLRAVGTNEDQVVLDVELVTTDIPAVVRLTSDRTQINTKWDDLSHVVVEIVDRHGRVVPRSEERRVGKEC